MKSTRLLTCIVTAVMLVSGGVLRADTKSAAAIQPVYIIRTTVDTVFYRWGDQTGASARSSLSVYDTSRVGFEHPLVMYSQVDTVEIQPSHEPVRVLIIFPADTVHETILFLTEQDWNQPDTAKIGLLKRYQTYNTTPVKDSLVFSYTSPSDSELTLLRTRYNLDSVAGKGDEFARAVNLLHWLHKRLRHDGTVNLPNPEPFTTSHILEVAAETNRPFHCGILASTMNDVYLAEGFKSRTIVCMPYDTADHECHQVTMIWSNAARKWILMDPTNDAWFTDSTGTPLSPFEVRAAMVNGTLLRLPDGINHNGDPVSAGGHINYMAKNLFLLKGWAYRIDPATGERQGLEVWFEPAGYNGHTLGVVQRTSESTYPGYYTDNAEWFFAPPK